MTEEKIKQFKFGDKIHYIIGKKRTVNAIYIDNGFVVIKSNSSGNYAFKPKDKFGFKLEIKRGWKR